MSKEQHLNKHTFVLDVGSSAIGQECAVRHEALCVEATVSWLAGTSSRQG